MDENQENGAANGGDVPEIELIIKDEISLTNQSYNPEQETQEHRQEVQHTHNQEKGNALKNIYITYIIETNPQNIIIRELNYNDSNVGLNDNNENLRPNSIAKYNEIKMKEGTGEFSKVPRIDSAGQSRICGDHCANIESTNLPEECEESLFDDIENNLDLNLKVEASTLQEDTQFCDCSAGVKKIRNSGALQMAVSAVLNDGMSLGQAAKKYKVVKSTIWSRVSKHPKHRRRKINNELAEIIHSKLSAGESLSEISRSLNIAKSTVHQHKTRLTKVGKLPPVLLLKKDREGGSSADLTNRLVQAHRGCRVNGMSVRFAAEFYSVPITTLWRFIKRRQQQTAPKNTLESKETTTNEELAEFDEMPTAAPTDIKTEEKFVGATEVVKTEIDPQHYQLFEDTYLKHLFD